MTWDDFPKVKCWTKVCPKPRNLGSFQGETCVCEKETKEKGNRGRKRKKEKGKEKEMKESKRELQRELENLTKKRG